MTHYLAETFYRMSMTWARDAETYRADGRPTVARYALRRHVELRERACTLANQAKAVKP